MDNETPTAYNSQRSADPDGARLLFSSSFIFFTVLISDS